MLSVLCRLPPSKSLMASFMFVISSDSVSVTDCAAAVEQVAKEQRATLDLVYLMTAIVSRKPNSVEEVMKALEGFTAHGGWDACEKGVWDLLMQFVRITGKRCARLLFYLSQEQLKRVFEQFPESKGWVMDFIDDENKNIPNYMTTLLRS